MRAHRVSSSTRWRGESYREVRGSHLFWFMPFIALATGPATYPDVSVVCGPLELDPEDPKGHTALNPALLVEVLSPSTEAYDRGEKIAHYKRIVSLREVVLVAQDERVVEVWARGSGDEWTRRDYRDGGVVRLEALGVELPLEDVYRDLLRP